jgi:endonuclease III
MKNATKHADTIKSLAKKLVKEHASEPREGMEPVRALVTALMSYDAPDDKAAEAMAKFDEEFVDLNEVRVATELEVAELLGKYPKLEDRAERLKAVLNHVFDREGVLGFERLKTLKRAEQRQFFKELPEMIPFVEAYVMMYAYDTPAFPVDAQTHEWLASHGATEPDASPAETQKLVESTLKGEDLHEFYQALRQAEPWSELAAAKKKK